MTDFCRQCCQEALPHTTAPTRHPAQLTNSLAALPIYPCQQHQQALLRVQAGARTIHNFTSKQSLAHPYVHRSRACWLAGQPGCKGAAPAKVCIQILPQHQVPGLCCQSGGVHSAESCQPGAECGWLHWHPIPGLASFLFSIHRGGLTYLQLCCWAGLGYAVQDSRRCRHML